MNPISSFLETTGAPLGAPPVLHVIPSKVGRTEQKSSIRFAYAGLTLTPARLENSHALAKFNIPAVRAVTLTLEIENGIGNRAVLSNISFSVQGSRSRDVILSTEGRNTAWSFRITINLETRNISMRFSLNYGGLSVRQALEDTRFYEAIAAGGEFRIVGQHPITGGRIELVHGKIPSGSYKGPKQNFTKILNALTYIESKTGVAFTIPKRDIRRKEASEIASTEYILRTGHAQYTAQPWTSVSPVERAKVALETFESGQVIPTAVHFEDQIQVIFETDVPLGPVTFFCDRTSMTKKDLKQLREKIAKAAPGSNVDFRLTPFEGADIEARYLNWVPEDEAKALRKLPMYKQNDELALATGVKAASNPAVALLESWYEDDAEEQKRTWKTLKTLLDEDRLSDRKLFP